MRARTGGRWAGAGVGFKGSCGLGSCVHSRASDWAGWEGGGVLFSSPAALYIAHLPYLLTPRPVQRAGATPAAAPPASAHPTPVPGL